MSKKIIVQLDAQYGNINFFDFDEAVKDLKETEEEEVSENDVLDNIANPNSSEMIIELNEENKKAILEMAKEIRKGD